MEYLTAYEIKKLTDLDERVRCIAEMTMPHSTSIAENLKMPALSNMEEHPDLAVLDGYKFTESKEDSIKKVKLLLKICKESLQNSPLLATIHEVLIDEMSSWTEEDFITFSNRPLFVDLEMLKLSESFFGLEQYESCLIPQWTGFLTNIKKWSNEKITAFFSKARFHGFRESPHAFQKWARQYLKGEITAETIVIKLPLHELNYEYIDAITRVLVADDGNNPSVFEWEKTVELLNSIKSALVSQNLWDNNPNLAACLNAVKLSLDILLGRRQPEEAVRFVAQGMNFIYRDMFFATLLRGNHFEAALNLIPNHQLYQTNILTPELGKFIKYLYDKHPEKLLK